jgi:hypothetical protein
MLLTFLDLYKEAFILGLLFPSDCDDITLQSPKKKSFSTFFKSRNWDITLKSYFFTTLDESKSAKFQRIKDLLRREDYQYQYDYIEDIMCTDDIGQFHYFFRVQLPEEKFLDNLPFAAASFCKSEKCYDEYMVDGCDENFITATNIHHCDFAKQANLEVVCLLNVYSTRIATLFLDKDYKPIERDKVYMRNKGGEADFFLSVDLEPERRNVRINLTEKSKRDSFASCFLDVN